MTPDQARKTSIALADDSVFQRNIMADTLRGVGFESIYLARDGDELLNIAYEHHPKIVIAKSRLPKLSGMDFTRMIRAGAGSINRATSIIIMTNTPTEGFLDFAQKSGVDEVLAVPFTGTALLQRIDAVLARQRPFIQSANYTGPCRRRRMLENYAGPFRRSTDAQAVDVKASWESDDNKAIMRQIITAMRDVAAVLQPGDRNRLTDLLRAAKNGEREATTMGDPTMALAAKSLSFYLSAMGISLELDREVVSTHVDVMQALFLLKSRDQGERDALVTGLGAIVKKKIGRAAA